jgi:hypothetical protein
MAILLRQNIELTNVPVGTCRVVFDAAGDGKQGKGVRARTLCHCTASNGNHPV